MTVTRGNRVSASMGAAGTQDEAYHHAGDNMPAHTHHDTEVLKEATVKAYWKANIRLLFSLLAVWFAVSFGAGILFVHQLNAFHIGGYPLGFWFAQQGSIYVFVGLIFFYAFRMHRIERRFGVDDDEEGVPGQ